MEEILISVLTHAWNRSELFGCLFDSMRLRSILILEWNIVDACSTDGTDELIGMMKSRSLLRMTKDKHSKRAGKVRIDTFLLDLCGSKVALC